MAESILAGYFAVNVIYPFLLIFTLIFAILQRSKVLGDGKKQIDALVALSIALISVAFTYATGVITKIVPILAVSAVVLLVFMILYGFVASADKDKGLILPPSIQWAFMGLIVIVIILGMIWATGQWNTVWGWFLTGGTPSGIATNVLLVVIIAAAMIVVLVPFGKKKSSS